MKVATITGATIVTAFGLASSYQITKRIEKMGWKQIEQKVGMILKSLLISIDSLMSILFVH